MEPYFFKTAEFAALCGVKRDTLLHYDHIGLLRPERVGENGYRYYTARQLATFDLIAALRRLDTPLSEIRDYLTRRSPEALLELLEEKEEQLEAERRRLDRMQSLLRSTVETARLSRVVKPDAIRLEQLPEAWCAVIPAPEFETFEESVFLLHIRDLLAWSREHGLGNPAVGDIVYKESLEKDSFLEDAYFCQVPAGTEGWELHRRPAGTYAVLYHQGPYESEPEACRRLRDWVLEQGYKIAGDLYEEDMVNYSTSKDPQAYLLKLYLPIEG